MLVLPNAFALNEEVGLRALRGADAAAFHSCALINLERLRPWFYWATDNMQLAQIETYIAQMESQSDPRQDFAYAFWQKETFAGSIGLHKIDWNNRIARVGYWIDRDFEGKGLVSRAVQTLVGAAFSQLQLNRIEIRCAPGNAASRAVPARLGFVEEGTHRQVLAIHGGFQDLVMYAMLACDWRLRSPEAHPRSHR
jgi:ribosomal-protein-serine acetyltransferase